MKTLTPIVRLASFRLVVGQGGGHHPAVGGRRSRLIRSRVFVVSTVRYAAPLVVVVKAGIRLFCCPPGGEYAGR
jgi:hypothetical protein